MARRGRVTIAYTLNYKMVANLYMLPNTTNAVPLALNNGQ